MKQDIKKKWLEALRSGKYKQGQRYLRTKTPEKGDCFCCLGVLCDIVEPDGWNLMPEGADTIGIHGGVSQGYPRVEVRIAAGFSSDEEMYQLARLNDRGISFADIANVIESDL